MPQPLNKITKKVTLSFANPGKYPLEERPDLLPLVMRVITEWTTLESIVNGTIVAIMGANAAPALAMLTALRNTGAQRDALQAAAAASLAKPDLAILTALTKRFKNLSRDRNKIVHWIWGVCPQIPDGLLLIPPEISGDFALKTGFAMINKNFPLRPETFDSILVYKADDFVNLAHRGGTLSEQFLRLQALLSSPVAQRNQLRSELYRELRIPPA